MLTSQYLLSVVEFLTELSNAKLNCFNYQYLLRLKDELIEDKESKNPNKFSKILLRVLNEDIFETETFEQYEKNFKTVIQLYEDDNEDDKDKDSQETQQRVGIWRELNLTWLADIPNNNKILSGKWWSITDEDAQVSVEKNLAKRLSLTVGDHLTFSLGSDTV